MHRLMEFARKLSIGLLIFLHLDLEAQVQCHGTKKVFNITCDPGSQKDCQSDSLETVATTVQEKTDVQIDIKIPQLFLNSNISFTSLNSLTINGEPGSTTIICTAAGAGIVLNDIHSILILNNLNLSFCGSKIITEFHSKTYISALTIVHCRNVELNELVIAKSRGLGLTILDHQGGRVYVKSATLKENKLLHEHDSTSEPVYGGGGMYILLEQWPHLVPMTFQFDHCTFENNIANTSHYNYLYTDVLGKVHKGYGRGGGVYLLLRSGLSNVSVSFLSCKFIANQAFLGGGLAVKIFGNKAKKIENITVEIMDSIFERNGCDSNQNHTVTTGFGGGAHLILDLSLDKPLASIADSHYSMKNVKFMANCAELGGGLYHFSSRQGFDDSLNSNTMLFDKCTFEQNTGHMGSAIIMAPNIDRRLSTGHSVVLTFLNCWFLDNAIFVNSNNQSTVGVGTIYASSYDIHFQGVNHFDNNWGTALYIVNGIINFQNSSVSFINNTGLQGGAVALIGSSIMIVGRNNYEFINNTALYRGGAVCVSLIDSIDFIGSRSCFIQYADNDSVISSAEWNANINFIGNKARDSTAGHAIYATSLHPCQTIRNSIGRYVLVDTSEVFTIRGFNFDDDPTVLIATDGTLFHSTKPTPLMIIPGELHKHGVTVTDELNRTVSPSFWGAITRKPKDFILDSTFLSFIKDEIQVRGESNNDRSATLSLHITALRQSYIELKVKLLDCPPGFMLSDDLECVCNADAFVGLFKCDMDDFHSHLLPGYWVGLIENGSRLVTSTCPFCDYSLSTSNTSDFPIVLPQIRGSSELSKTVCGETRTGIACGRCQDNYTVHFHSPDFLCKPTEPAGCKFGWLFYILSELAPVTVVFITVLVFNISFTSGSVNGFILFSQIIGSLDIDASGVIVFPNTAKDTIKHAKLGYQVIYGFFNLDIFNSESLSFCLWNGASALDMFAFKYFTILYTVLLIVAVIWIMNKCGGRWLGKYCRITAIKTSVIHGISSFLVISYAQCVKVSLSLLLQVHIHAEQDSTFRPHTRVWYNGELVYFSKEHLPYALPALFCLLTVGLIPPILLLTYPLLNKVMAILGLKIQLVSDTYSSLKPLLDSFQGCFKDNSRFFAGIYFFYRWTILLVHMNSRHFNTYYTTVGGVLLFMLTLHTICQPYLKRVHNIIDILLLSNLVLINSLSLFNYHTSHSPRTQYRAKLSTAEVQLVLIYLPIVAMCVCLIVTFCKCTVNHGLNRLSQTSTTSFCPERTNMLRELAQTVTSLLNKNLESVEEEEFTHTRHTDEDVEYKSACEYLKRAR